MWRDVRRSLGGARPLKEYQQKYKLLIAEKKEARLRAAREQSVAPDVVQPFEPAPAHSPAKADEMTCEDL